MSFLFMLSKQLLLWLECVMCICDFEFLEIVLNVGARFGVDKKWGIGEPKQ